MDLWSLGPQSIEEDVGVEDNQGCFWSRVASDSLST